MTPDELQRFEAKVERMPDGGCWIWTASRKRFGYGQFFLRRRIRPAHRVAYEHFVGPIPAGLQLDHLCRQPACVNPAHLEPVTAAENLRRGLNGVLSVTRTHCRRGHERNEKNVYVDPSGTKVCRRCRYKPSRGPRGRMAKLAAAGVGGSSCSR